MTTTQVIENSNIPAKLIRAVIKQLGGTDSLTDIANHGVDGGFSGFIYYTETVEFFKRNRKEITELVHSMADDLGEEPATMVLNFGCLMGRKRSSSATYSQSEQEEKRETLASIYRCLGGGKLTDDDTQVANALAWFAAEEVARAFENN